MKPEAGDAHVLNRAGGVESGEDVTQFLFVILYHAARIVVPIEAGQALVPDRLDHRQS